MNRTAVNFFLLLGFVGLSAAVYLVQHLSLKSMRREALVRHASLLLAAGDVQVQEIIPGLLLKEEAGAINYVLDRYKQKETLSNIWFVPDLKSLPSDLGTCGEVSSVSRLCIDLNRNTATSIHQAVLDGNTLGYLVKQKIDKWTRYGSVQRTFLWVFGILALGFLGLTLWIALFLDKFVRRPLLTLGETLKPGTDGVFNTKQTAVPRVQEIQKVTEQVRELIRQHQDVKAKAVLGTFASQVGHDLISPIKTLQMKVEGLTSVTQEEKEGLNATVEKIRQIALNLRNKRRQLEGEEALSAESDEPRAIQDIIPILKQAIEEKRFQYKGREKLSIHFNTSNGEEVPLPIQKLELSRIISNLIDNSVEAMEDGGEIRIEIRDEGERVAISVSDTGKGIPAHILPRLGELGKSFGKKAGAGLGLYHARETIQGWSGALQINSESGKGTTVTIFLNKEQKKMDVMCRELSVPKNGQVVIVDDEEAFFRVWQDRFKDCKQADSPTLKYVKSVSQLRKWLNRNKKSTVPTFFLVDFNIEGSECDGLSAIEKLGLAQNSVLVTGCAREEDVQERCRKLGVTVIDKAFLHDVPIVQTDGNERLGATA